MPSWSSSFAARAAARTLTAFVISTACMVSVVATPSAARAELAPPMRLVVLVDTGESALDAGIVRTAISTELGVPVVALEEPAAGEQRLDIRVLGEEASVKYFDTEGAAIGRVITLPGEDARAVETIALLAGNLVRNEAADLLAALKKPEPAPPGPETPAEPTPAEKPPEPKPKPAAPEPDDKKKEEAGRDEEKRPTLGYRPVNLSVIHPLSIDPKIHEKKVNLELGLFYSRVGAVDGAALSGFVQRVDYDVKGAVVAGIFDQVGGDTEGLVLGGIGGTAEGDLEGVGLGGIFRWRAGTVRGLQAGGIFVRAEGVDGAQLAPVNSAERLDGAQLGVVNVADDGHGFQLALVNVTEKMDGTMIGMVNVAPELDGDAIGLVSITEQLRVRGVAWASSTALGNVGLKLRNGSFYSMFAVGVQPENGGQTVSPGVFLGGHVDLDPAFVNIDVGYSGDFIDSQDADPIDGLPPQDSQSARVRASVGLGVTSGFDVFGGVGARVQIFDVPRSETRIEPDFFAGVQLF